jgi:hypothetical protein
MEVKTNDAAKAVSRGSKLRGGANALASLLLVVGIIVLLNVLSTRFFWRVDLTDGNLNSLSQASIGAIQETDGIRIRVFISPGLPEKIDTAWGQPLQPRVLAERFRDMIEEYAANGTGTVHVEYVHPEEVLEEAKRAKIPAFSSQEAELMGGGVLKFKEYVIGATFVYRTASSDSPKRSSS